MIRFSRSAVRYAASALSLLLLAPVLAAAQVAWVKSYDDALKQAASQKKFVLLDISATW